MTRVWVMTGFSFLYVYIVYVWELCVSQTVYVCSSVLQKLSLVHVNSNQCLDKASEDDSQVPSVRDCIGARSQQWLLRNVTLPEIFWDHTHKHTDGQTDGLSHGCETERDRERTASLNTWWSAFNRSIQTELHMYMNLPSLHRNERKMERETRWSEHLSLMPRPLRSRRRGRFGYVYENASLLEYHCVFRVSVENVWARLFSTEEFRPFNLIKPFRNEGWLAHEGEANVCVWAHVCACLRVCRISGWIFLRCLFVDCCLLAQAEKQGLPLLAVDILTPVNQSKVDNHNHWSIIYTNGMTDYQGHRKRFISSVFVFLHQILGFCIFGCHINALFTRTVGIMADWHNLIKMVALVT